MWPAFVSEEKVQSMSNAEQVVHLVRSAVMPSPAGCTESHFFISRQPKYIAEHLTSY
jgi:hypothetical protein